MKLFGKEVPGPKPRLSGETQPVYSAGAKNAFVTVLQRALDVQIPGRLGTSYTDPATELESAVQIASSHCNDELLSRMNDFRDAVLDASRGEGGEQEVNRAREVFTKGCREALGNDK